MENLTPFNAKEILTDKLESLRQHVIRVTDYIESEWPDYENRLDYQFLMSLECKLVDLTYSENERSEE